MNEAETEARIAATDEMLRAWLELPEVALVAGRWDSGSIMELVLDRNATLTPPAYRGRFSGLRDVTVRGQRHHMHLDLGRVARVTYAVTPSVCYGFRPSFEVRFGAGAADEDHAFTLSLLGPYRGAELDVPRVEQYFALLGAHARRGRGLVHFVVDSGGRKTEHAETWRAIGRCFARVAGDETTAPEAPEALAAAVHAQLFADDAPPPSALPAPLAVLDEALALRGASLVVYRARTLVEFKTERLRERVSAYEEAGHRSWQIGAFDDHHCHLDLDAITRVLFDAEPVSCQGGKTNWTVWFLGDKDCGNPYRPEAVCSVTLNGPYTDEGAPETAIINGVYALHERARGHAFVSASERFVAARP